MPAKSGEPNDLLCRIAVDPARGGRFASIQMAETGPRRKACDALNRPVENRQGAALEKTQYSDTVASGASLAVRFYRGADCDLGIGFFHCS